MSGAVYIPSKARVNYLEKTIPRWLDRFNGPIYIVADRSDLPEYRLAIQAAGWPLRVRSLSTGRDGAGIGFTRNFAVKHAANNGHEVMILADDDLRPLPGDRPDRLLTLVKRKDRLAIGATWSYHGLLSGGATENRANGLMLCPSGWGHNFFALNVENTLKCGNFNSRLYCAFEDDELQRQGIARGFPWLVHCDVKYQNLGKRFTAGGVSAQFDERLSFRMNGIVECQKIVSGLWPDYVAAPPKRNRTAWGKLMDYYMPGWREKSVIHGGHL